MVLDYLCCDALTESRDTTIDDDSITCSTDDGILECDYDTQVTKLYHGIEERQWEEVLYFLETGSWYTNSFFNAFASQGDKPSVQAKTWVTALDDDGNVRWCQLPLHAAVTFLAPFAVIRKLVEIYPKSVRCADDQDMLPLHYAFRFGASDDVLVHLLQKFPQAVSKKAVKDRLPLDLAQYGPRPERGIMIDYYMQSAVKNAKSEWDGEYEKMVSHMKEEKDREMERDLETKTNKLNETLDELLATRKELDMIKTEMMSRTRNRTHAQESREDASRGSIGTGGNSNAVSNQSSPPSVNRNPPRSTPGNTRSKNTNSVKNGAVRRGSKVGSHSAGGGRGRDDAPSSKSRRSRSRSRGRASSDRSTDPSTEKSLSTTEAAARNMKRGLVKLFKRKN